MTWEMVWPGICEYLGLKAVEPAKDKEELNGEAWDRSKFSEWESWIYDRRCVSAMKSPNKLARAMLTFVLKWTILYSQSSL